MFISPQRAEEEPPTIEFIAMTANILYLIELSIILPVVSMMFGMVKTPFG